jgi:hypothetical protein
MINIRCIKIGFTKKLEIGYFINAFFTPKDSRIILAFRKQIYQEKQEVPDRAIKQKKMTFPTIGRCALAQQLQPAQETQRAEL